MSKRTEITVELLERILPALRMMVRFPSRPAKVVSFETGIELADIYAYTDARGRPKQQDLDRVETEVAEGAVGAVSEPPAAEPTVQLAKADPFRNPKPTRMDDLPETEPGQDEEDDDDQASDASSPNQAPTDPWIGRRVHADSLRAYVPVMRLLVEDPSLSAAEACRRCGLTKATSDNTFSHWRSGLFGDAAVDPAMFARFVTWANEQLIRRRQPVLESEQSAPAAQNTKSETAITGVPAKSNERKPYHEYAYPRTMTPDSARNDDHGAVIIALLKAAEACNAAAAALVKVGAA